MRLKILILPFSIIVTVFLMIGIIKPNFAVMQEKRAVVATKSAQSDNMATLLNNITMLLGELESDKASEAFVFSYLPRNRDQERVIDMLNFLANQSGVVLVTMGLKEIETVQSDEDALPMVDEAGIPLPVGYQSAIPKSFSAEVTVKGSYDNIKNFFDRVEHMSRYHKTGRFSVVAVPETAGSTDAPGTLTGIFQANFDYLAVRKVGSALNVPIFTQGQFDLSRLESVEAWVTQKVPVLEKPTSGRPNPFQ